MSETTAKKPESSASDLLQVLRDNPVNPSERYGDRTMRPADAALFQRPDTSTQFSDEVSLRNKSKEQLVEEATDDADPNFITGFDFNYEFMGGNNYMIDDLHELQAERQPGFSKFKRGSARLLGEFALNVLETPGVLAGGLAATVTGDINQMTDNFWVNATEKLKTGLSEYNPVYTRQFSEEGGVWDKMTSGEWIATEGVSALAFMASALVPGLGVSKLGKVMSLTRAASKGGAASRSAIAAIDKFAIKSGMAAAGEGKALGQASGSMVNLINTTLTNTVYEAGVEAKGAQQAFEAEVKAKLNSGEIDYAQYVDAMKNSADAAAKTFASNMAILIGPNMVMSKMMIGPRGNTISKVHKNMHKSKAGKWVKGAEKLKDAPKSFVGKLGQSEVAKAFGTGAKAFGQNTLREGVWEEGAQMAVESYYTDEYIEALISGEDHRNILKSYAEVLQSTDGQIAALTGGIISGPMSMRSRHLEGKNFRQKLDNTVNTYNNHLNYYKASRVPLYEVNEDGEFIYEETTNEAGEKIKTRKVDVAKLKQLSDSKIEVDQLQAAMNIAMQEGNVDEANIIASRLQAQAFLPFIENGKEGITQLRESLVESEAVAMAVKEYNEENGTDISQDEYINKEIDKANEYLSDMKFFEQNIGVATSLSWERKNRGEVDSDVWKSVDALRTNFNEAAKGNYIQAKSVEGETKNQLELVSSKLEDAKERKASGEIIANLEARKATLEDKLGKATETVNKFENKEEYEKNWALKFANFSKASKYVSGELTGYLDDVISSIKSASTTDELIEIISKAGTDGLIISDIKYKALPKDLIAMAKGNNLLEAYGAMQVIAMHSDTEAQDVSAENEEHVKALSEGVSDIFKKTVEAAAQSLSASSAFQIKLAGYKDGLNKVADSLTKADKALDNHLLRDRHKYNNASEFHKATRELVKARNAAVETHSKVVKEVAATEKAIIKELNKFKSYRNVIAALRDNAPSIEAREAWTSVLETMGEDIDIDQATALFKRVPVDVDSIIEALKYNKKVVIEQLNEATDSIQSAGHIEELKSKLTSLYELQGKLQSSIKKTNDLIKKLKRIKSKEERDSISALLNEELATLQESWNSISNSISEAENELLANELESFTSVRNAQELIDNMNAILAGEPIETDTPGTASRAARSMDTVIKEYNSLGSVANSEFDKAIAGLKAFEKELKYVKEYIKYASEAREVGADKIDGYTEYVNKIVSSSTESSEQAPDTETEETDLVSRLKKAAFTIKPVSIPKNTKLLQGHPYEGLYYDLYNSDNMLHVVTRTKLYINALFKDSSNEGAIKGLYHVLNTYPEMADAIVEELVTFGIEITFDGIRDEARQEIKDIHVSLDDTVSSVDSSTDEVVAGLSDPGIQKAVKDIIEAQRLNIQADKLNAKLKKFDRLLKDKKSFWDNIIEKFKLIAVGNKVHWNIGDKDFTGRVISFIRTEGQGTNVLLRDEDGKLHMVAAAGVTKANFNASDENIENLAKHQAVRDANKNETVGPLQFVKIGIRSDEHKRVVKNGKIKVVDPSTGEIIEQYNPLLRYMEEARDKSQDTYRFFFTKSLLDNDINNLERVGDTDNRIPTLRKVKEILGKIQNSEVVSAEDMRLFTAHIPISFRIARGDGTPGEVGGYINTKDAGGPLFDALELALREKIVSEFMHSRLPLGTNNEIMGVTAKAKFSYTGNLNKDVDGKNAINTLRGVSLDNMKLFVVGKESSGLIISRSGRKTTAPSDVIGKDGAVFLTVKDNNGKDFNLRLTTNKLEGTPELDLLDELIFDIMGRKYKMGDKIHAEMQTQLEETIPLLAEVFKGKDITYTQLINTIMFVGDNHSQAFVKLNASDGILSIGEDRWDAASYTANREVIKKLLGLKLQNISFPTRDKNIPTVKDPLYLKYIVEGKAISTEVKADAAIFVGKTTDENYVDGINPYMSHEEISYYKPKEANKPKDQKDKPEDKGKLVKLSPKAVRKLQRLKVNLSNLSNKAKEYIMSTYEKTGSITVQALEDYNGTITAAKEEAGDTVIKINCK